MAQRQETPKTETLKEAPVYNLRDAKTDAALTLTELLGHNHQHFAVLREPRMIFHNHVPHALGSSYLLGATADKLREVYSAEKPNLISVTGLRSKQVTRTNWREFWGNKEYTVAYMDFFDGELASRKDWETVADEFLWSGQKPLVNGFISGLGHPFIHLAYGYEFDNQQVVAEALSLGCTEYSDVHCFFDSAPNDTSTYKTTKLEDVLNSIHKDPRFDGYSSQPGAANLAIVMERFQPILLEHWTALVVDDANAQFKDWLRAAALLATSTAHDNGQYDFFLAHVLTVGHALRVLLPRFRPENRLAVMKQYAMFAMLTYVMQLRPAFASSTPASHDDVEPASDWDAICAEALASRWSTDVHWAKVVRALKMLGEVRSDEDVFSRRAATRFISSYQGWTGFGLGVGDE